MSARRRLLVAGVALVAVSGTVLASPASAAEDGRVSVREWARRVCVATIPAAESLLDDVTATPPDNTSVSAADVEARVAHMDGLVDGVERLLGDLRGGMVDAGIPRLRGATRQLRVLVRELDEVLRGFETLHEEIERFGRDVLVDPDRAVDRVTTAAHRYLSRDAFAGVVEVWPPWFSEELARVPDCMVLVGVLGDTTGAA